IETEDGLIGHGLTSITQEKVIETIINEVVAPALIGEDALAHEACWDRMYWLMTSRGQSGYASHATAAVDVALWDLKGRYLNQPIWRLLGGARREVPVYATFGFDFLDIDGLKDAAAELTKQGIQHLKMVVGHRAMQRRDLGRSLLKAIQEDAKRVCAVRD